MDGRICENAGSGYVKPLLSDRFLSYFLHCWTTVGLFYDLRFVTLFLKKEHWIESQVREQALPCSTNVSKVYEIARLAVDAAILYFSVNFSLKTDNANFVFHPVVTLPLQSFVCSNIHSHSQNPVRNVVECTPVILVFAQDSQRS